MPEGDWIHTEGSRHVITEAGSGVVWPQVREYHQKLEEGKEWIVP